MVATNPNFGTQLGLSLQQRDDEKLDVVVLGASGFTGKYVVREFVKRLSEAKEGGGFTMGLAGRNAARLETSLAWAVATCSTGHPPCPTHVARHIALIEADVRNTEDMERVCSRARVLANCVGPYLEYGEPIVAACVAAGVHYLDISGEAEFLEKMEVKYGQRAVETQTLVVSTCGTVSLISDLGVLFHLRSWPPSAVPSCVDAYVRFHSFTCSYAASAQTGFLALSHAGRLAALRRSAPKRPKLKIPGDTPIDKGEMIHRQELGGVEVWATALPICDRAVVRRTFWGLHGHELGLPTLDKTITCNSSSELPGEVAAVASNASKLCTVLMRERMWKPIRPVHYRVFFAAFQLRNAVLFAVLTRVAARLAPWTWGQKLLQRFPAVFTAGRFTHKGPSEEELASMWFEAWFVGRGFSSVKRLASDHAGAGQSDVEVVTRVQGPEPAYVATAIGVVECALLCLRSRASLPVGGVLTPATTFGGTDLEQRL